MNSLSITNLSKTYPNGVKAMDGLNLEIETGMFGLLGPNGAGKSTLMRTIATLQNPDSGNIYFNEINILEDPMSLRKLLGYLPQEFGVYPNLSAENLLDYFARLKGISSKVERTIIVQEVLEITNLYEVRTKHVDGYSGGMKQRFGIAQMLLNKPKLIIVDEPTAGLDPTERHRFLNVIREIGNLNTVIFSTHIVEDVTDLCTHLAILNQGKILTKTTPYEATSALKGHIWTKVIQPEELSHYEQKCEVLSSNYTQENKLSIRVFAQTNTDESFISAPPKLDDVYFLTIKSDTNN